MRQLVISITLTAALAVGGCGPSQPESVADTAARYTRDLVTASDALAAVHDQDSAVTAARDYLAFMKSALDIADQMKTMTPAEKAAFNAQSKSDRMRALTNLRKLYAYPAAVKVIADGTKDMMATRTAALKAQRP